MRYLCGLLPRRGADRVMADATVSSRTTVRRRVRHLIAAPCARLSNGGAKAGGFRASPTCIGFVQHLVRFSRLRFSWCCFTRAETSTSEKRRRRLGAQKARPWRRAPMRPRLPPPLSRRSRTPALPRLRAPTRPRQPAVLQRARALTRPPERRLQPAALRRGRRRLGANPARQGLMPPRRPRPRRTKGPRRTKSS